MTAMPEILDRVPAGAVPPSQRAGLQFKLDMMLDAIRFHKLGDETDPPCCSHIEPCELRARLEASCNEIEDQIRDASQDQIQTDPEPEQRIPDQINYGTRKVVADPASEKQIGFIRTLADERETDQIGTFPARTLAEIRAGSEVSKSRASSLITALMNARKKAGSPAGPGPTPAQISLIETMAREQGREIPADLTRQTASDLIADLTKIREKVQTAVTETGMYRAPNGTIYKVQKSRTSQRLYAKRLVELDEPRQMKGGLRTHDFVYDPDAIRSLTADMLMTLDQAKAWGRETGTCCSCGALLTNPESIEDGIGPICGGRW